MPESSTEGTQQQGKQPIPGYALMRKLGEGGMAATYLARQASMDRLVAIKIMRRNLARDTQFIDRFKREAKLAGSLNHVNIVAVHDVGEGGGFHYLAMEYVEGRSATEIIPDTGGLDEETALHITMQVARALKLAHQHGIIHRDIKPDNILVTDEKTAKVCDFGLARQTGEESHMTQTGIMMGTPHYVSPEQARGESDIDIRADIYSLGATLYRFVTGETPFTGSTAAVVMTKHLTEELPWPQDINPAVSENVCLLIARMMAKDRDDRYLTPDELIADLELVTDGKAPAGGVPAAGGSALGSKGQVGTRPTPRKRRSERFAEDAGTAGKLLESVGRRGLPARLWIGIGTAALLLVMALAGWAMTRGGNRPDAAGAKEAAAAQAWAETISPLQELESREQAIEFLAKLTAFEGTHAATDFAKSKIEEIARLKASAELKVEPGGPSTASSDEKLKEMYEFARNRWKSRPDDFAGAIAQFKCVREAGKKTKWAMMADDAITEVNKARAKAAEAVVAGLKKEAEKLAGAGDFDAAIAAFGKPPKKFADLLKARFDAERKQLREQAESKLGALLSAAEQFSKDGQPGKGLAELAKAKSLKYAALDAKTSALETRLTKESADAAGMQARHKAAKARNKFEGILDKYDKLILAGSFKSAGGHVSTERKSLDAETLKLMPQGLAAAEQAAAQLASWQIGRAKALKKLIGRKIELKKRVGGTTKGTVQAVTADAFKVNVRFRIGGTVGESLRTVKFADLAPGEMNRLLPAFIPAGADGQIAAALLAMSQKEFAAAKKALAAAGEHQLAGRYRDKLEVMRVGAKEAAARKADAAAQAAWEKSIQPLVKPSYATESEGKPLMTALQKFFADHGTSRFAIAKKSEAAELRARAGGMERKVRQLFRGQVLKFDPKTLAIELSWDFSDPRQLEDFDLLAGDWKVADGMLLGETDIYETCRGGILPGLIARPKAWFGSECRARVSAVVKQGHGAYMQLGAPRDQVALAMGLLRYLGKSNPRARLYRFYPTKRVRLVERKHEGLKPATAYPLEMTLSRGQVSATFGGKSVGEVKDVGHRSVQVALGVGHAHVTDPTIAGFDNLHVLATLDRAWLERALKPKPPPPPSAFRAQWQEIKTPGDKPGKRSVHPTALAYDSKRKRNVLFGGLYEHHNDLWTLDLATARWTCLLKTDLKSSGRPGLPGTGHWLSYDPTADKYRILLWSWAYDPSTNAWKKGPAKLEHAGTMSMGSQSGLAYDPDGKRYLFVPQTNTQFSWFVYPDAARAVPQPRPAYLGYRYGGLGYDRKNKVFVMHATRRLPDKRSITYTWAFNPATTEWREMRPATRPPVRSGHKLVWHDKLGAFVMFGGRTGGKKDLNDLWVYETAPDRWTQVKAPAAPPPRHGATTYDAAHDRLVLFNHAAQTWTCKIERIGR